jgi:hypothetical protein
MVDGMRRFFKEEPEAPVTRVVFAVPEPDKFAVARRNVSTTCWCCADADAAGRGCHRARRREGWNVSDERQTDRVLEAVWSCLQSSWPAEAKALRGLKGKGLDEARKGLTQLERIPTLETGLWIVVVLAKAVLAGTRQEQEMWDEMKKVQGL